MTAFYAYRALEVILAYVTNDRMIHSAELRIRWGKRWRIVGREGEEGVTEVHVEVIGSCGGKSGVNMNWVSDQEMLEGLPKVI